MSASTVLARRILASWFTMEAAQPDDAIAAFNRKRIAAGLVALDPSTFAVDTYARAVAHDVEIASGSPNLSSVSGPWVAADVGKLIYIQGAGVAGATLTARILSVGGAGSIVLDTNAGTTVNAGDSATAGIAVWGLSKDQQTSDGSSVQLPAATGPSVGFTGAQNTGVGKDGSALGLDTEQRTAVGAHALKAAGAGEAASSVAVGSFALTHATGDDNTAVGQNSGGAITTGQGNVAVGKGALAAATDAQSCTVVGKDAGATASGSDNTLIGRDAGHSITTGDHNTCVGRSAGYSIGVGSENVIIGYGTATNGALHDAVVIGSGAAVDASGAKNTIIGKGAAAALGLGSENVVVGEGAAGGMTTVSDNTIVGAGAAPLADASGNTAIGRQALPAATSGGLNVAVGEQSGKEVTTGTGNAMVGYQAGLGLGNVSNVAGFGVGSGQGIYFTVDQPGNMLHIQVRYADGTFKTADVPLT